jgi:hypothetical protein
MDIYVPSAVYQQKGYYRSVSCALNVISTLSLLSRVDTYTGELLVPDGIIAPLT